MSARVQIGRGDVTADQFGNAGSIVCVRTSNAILSSGMGLRESHSVPSACAAIAAAFAVERAPRPLNPDGDRSITCHSANDFL